MKSLVVLISGQGRNLQALIDGCADGRIPARLAAVLSNRADAAGLQRARSAGIPVEVVPHGEFSGREAFDAALAQRIAPYRPDIVALAGFMRVLTPGFVAAHAGRLLNIHPSLLPKYPGLRTHERVLAAGDRQHGATVHFVTEALDGGPAVIQGELMVQPQDTAANLAERVMSEIELKIYPQAVAWMAQDRLQWRQGGAWFDGRPLAGALGMERMDAEFQ
jgi:phosphoribosylglycinamide formyltransferase 1